MLDMVAASSVCCSSLFLEQSKTNLTREKKVHLLLKSFYFFLVQMTAAQNLTILCENHLLLLSCQATSFLSEAQFSPESPETLDPLFKFHETIAKVGLDQPAGINTAGVEARLRGRASTFERALLFLSNRRTGCCQLLGCYKAD